MGFAWTKRKVLAGATLTVAQSQGSSFYRNTDTTLTITAVDGDGSTLTYSNITVDVELQENGVSKGGSDVLRSSGTPFTQVTLQNGVFQSTTFDILGEIDKDENVTIAATATGHTGGSSDAFTIQEYGVKATLYDATNFGRNRGGLASDGTYLYFGCDTAGASGDNLWRISLSDFSTKTGYDLTALASGFGGNVMDLTIDGTSLYVIDESGYATKINLTTMAVSDTADLGQGNQQCLIDGDYLYVAPGSATDYLQCNKSDLSVVYSGALETGGSYGVMCTDGDFIYEFASHDGTKVEKRSVADLSVITDLDVSSYITSGDGGTNKNIAYANGYVYLRSIDDDNVIQINSTTMAYVATYDNATYIDYPSQMIGEGDHLWIFSRTTKNVIKIKVSDMSLVWSIDLSAYMSTSCVPGNAICIQGDHIYATVNDAVTNGTTIIKVAK